MSRPSPRDVRAGFVVLLAIAGFFGLLALAGGGPGFLAASRGLDVVFRDGQGIRPGSPVRVAGIDAGRVVAVDLTEREGLLWARVRVSIPEDLATRLRQDARITIQPSLTGAPCLNIVSTGQSTVTLVPGQVVEGVPSSLFDPVLEQVGLGPVERDNLSQTIAEVRKTVEEAGPRLRQVLGHAQETVANLRDTSESLRPAVENTAGRLESLVRKLDEAGLDRTVTRVEALVAQTEVILAENRPLIQQTLTGAKDLTASLGGIAINSAPQIATLLAGLETTRKQADVVLGHTGVLAANSSDLLVRNKANIDRTMTNVKEATDHGVALVQKLRGNPFYLSPFYKPSKEDIHAQEVYDAAGTFLIAARELNDALTRLQGIRSTKPLPQMTADEQKYYNQLFQRAWTLQSQLEQTNRQLADGIRESTRR